MLTLIQLTCLSLGVRRKSSTIHWVAHESTGTSLFTCSTYFYCRANPVFCKSLCSDWFFLSQDFAVRTVSIQSAYFCFEAKPANSKFATKAAKKKVWILSFFTLKLPEEAKKIEIFPKVQRWMEKTNIFKRRPPEVHFTIRNRVPYSKQLTNLACSSRTVEYWPSVVFVRTSLHSLHTVTISVQYSPVRPLR